MPLALATGLLYFAPTCLHCAIAALVCWFVGEERSNFFRCLERLLNSIVSMTGEWRGGHLRGRSVRMYTGSAMGTFEGQGTG